VLESSNGLKFDVNFWGSCGSLSDVCEVGVFVTMHGVKIKKKDSSDSVAGGSNRAGYQGSISKTGYVSVGSSQKVASLIQEEFKAADTPERKKRLSQLLIQSDDADTPEKMKEVQEAFQKVSKLKRVL